ncbi:MAG: hypothetical protein ABIJ34_06000 [archaeon]
MKKYLALILMMVVISSFASGRTFVSKSQLDAQANNIPPSSNGCQVVYNDWDNSPDSPQSPYVSGLNEETGDNICAAAKDQGYGEDYCSDSCNSWPSNIDHGNSHFACCCSVGTFGSCPDISSPPAAPEQSANTYQGGYICCSIKGTPFYDWVAGTNWINSVSASLQSEPSTMLELRRPDDNCDVEEKFNGFTGKNEEGMLTQIRGACASLTPVCVQSGEEGKNVWPWASSYPQCCIGTSNGLFDSTCK